MQGNTNIFKSKTSFSLLSQKAKTDKPIKKHLKQSENRKIRQQGKLLSII